MILGLFLLGFFFYLVGRAIYENRVLNKFCSLDPADFKFFLTEDSYYVQFVSKNESFSYDPEKKEIHFRKSIFRLDEVSQIWQTRLKSIY